MIQRKFFRIFALLLGTQLYIGKTFSRRLSAVYHRHCRGEMLATACFSKSSQTPTLHMLFGAEMQAFEAYRYIIAFIHFFRNAGYEILNSPKSIERSENLHSATQAIVDVLQSTDPEILLMDTMIRNPTEADISLEVASFQPTKETADQKLTIRLTPFEKKHFNKIGEDLALNQHDTLLYLFDKCNQIDPVFLDLEGDTYLRALINAYREEIEKLNNQNAALAKKLSMLRESGNARTARLQKEFADAKLAVDGYFNLLDNATAIPLEIEYDLYKNYPHAMLYTYPEVPGVYTFRPQAVLRGRGRYSAQFILGTAEDGRNLKFRYYPRHNYLGVPIPDSQFATRGSVWVVSCKIANDNAVDLTGSLPLTVRFRNS